MATISTINVGISANDGSGDTIRAGGQKINTNFDNINSELLFVSGVAYGAFAGLSDKVNISDVHYGTTSVDFGSTLSNVATVTILADWVYSTKTFLFNLIDSPDHNIEECLLEGLTFNVSSVIDETSFVLMCTSSDGTTGVYNFKYLVY